jgi:hypothetical protein
VNRSRIKILLKEPGLYPSQNPVTHKRWNESHTNCQNNESLKHTRKHEKGREESNQEAKLTGSGVPSGQEGRTVRTGLADCLACYRGLSAPTLRTVWPYATDRPLNHTEPTEATHEPRTVRGEHADCPPGTRGPSTLCCGPSETPSNRKPKSRRIETKGEQEHEKHGTDTSGAERPLGGRGPSARLGQSRKTPDLESQLPQIIIGFPKRLTLWRQRFGDLKSITQGCYSPKILPPNSLNHRESRIL